MSSKAIAVVTGGAGFIGSHMVDLLAAEGFRVHVIDNLTAGRELNLEHHRRNPDVVFEKKDIRTLAADDRLFRGASYVFHFAGIGDIVPSIDRPVDYLSTNVLGTVHVLEAARHAAVEKLVYAASSTCYGLAKELPTTEAAPILPQYPYALSKYQGEEAVLHWGEVHRLPVNSIRIFNAYGMRSRTTGAYGAVFGVFLAQKLAGKPLTIVGDGTQRRDFLYVTDVVRAFYAAAKAGRAQRIYNLGAGNPQSVNHLASLVGGSRVHIPWRPGEPECTWADITRIQTELGWSPIIHFEDGVKTMLENIDYWREAPLWDVESIETATKTWFTFLDKRGCTV
jgi:UDP-glucose 4-epimerase